MVKPRTKTAIRKKSKKHFSLFVLFALLGIGFFVACNTSNNNPAQPFTNSIPKVPTNSPTGTITSLFTPTFTGTLPTSTLTPTNTPTGIVNTNTPTLSPTQTWTPASVPPFVHNYGTSAAPNGMYYDGAGNLYIAEAETKAGTIVTGFEAYTNSGGGVLAFNYLNNQIASGQATPCVVYQPTPYSFVVSTAHYPVGVAVSSPSGSVFWGGYNYPGEIEILDLQVGGAATLYVENNYVFCPPALDEGPFMDNATGFGGAPFNNPKCLTADSQGNFYVADTGNGYVDQFDGGGALCSPLCSPAWLHRWNGSGSNFGASVTFKTPNSLACDSFGNVYVGDSGPYVTGGVTTSMVQVYTTGGTTIIGSFPLIAGCVVNGITADSLGDFFVSDTSNGEVEEYKMIGWTGALPNGVPLGTVLTQAGLRRAWGDPHGYHEFAPYTPSCLQFIGAGYIVSGDSGNDFLNVFGPGLP